MQLKVKSEIVEQLDIVVGRLRAANELVDAGRPYVEVVHQLEAVRTTLREIGDRLITCRSEQDEEITTNGSRVARMAELPHLLTLNPSTRFSRIAQARWMNR